MCQSYFVHEFSWSSLGFFLIFINVYLFLIRSPATWMVFEINIVWIGGYLLIKAYYYFKEGKHSKGLSDIEHLRFLKEEYQN